MHYEVERRHLDFENQGIGVLQVTGQGWRTVTVFRDTAIPTPLTFDSLGAARTFAGRYRPGRVRIIRVTDDGEREVVEDEPRD